MTRPNAFIFLQKPKFATRHDGGNKNWSVAAAADFTPHSLKPGARKNTAFVLREQTAYLGSFECMYIQHDFDIN